MTLYIVSTPIGNLEDITLRALRVLREVSLIAAEDTRHTRKLLQRYEIETPCISYHEHSGESRLQQIVEALGRGDVALVSDAGTPSISDPGYDLVRACLSADIPVVPIPGPSAPVAALVASGLPSDRYYFLGFLPRKPNERRAFLAEVAAIPATLICFESPHRVEAALADVLAVLGDRQVVVARELTKLHEELLRAPASAVLAQLATNGPRGEVTLLIAGAGRHSNSPAATPDVAPTDEQIMARLRELRAEGLTGSAAARRAAKELGVSKAFAYDLWVRLSETLGEDE